MFCATWTENKGPARKSILVVSHDAGGAEVISAWVKKHKEGRYQFLLEGPAVKIFSRKLPNIPLVTREVLDSNLQNFNLVLAGTGWESDLEKRAIVRAREKGVKVAAYLDHWTGYQERFMLDNRITLPDEIWVGDRHAHALATSTFPGCPVKLEPNLYFEELLASVRAVTLHHEKKKGIRVLYVCEPTSRVAQKNYGDPRYWGYTEFEALEGYLRFAVSQAKDIARIRVRLHPTEQSGKYHGIIDQYRQIFEIEESGERPLIEDCAWADWIVGCQSMSMVIGVLLKKPVFSCIPAGGQPLALPFGEIVALFNPRGGQPEPENLHQ
jgi:hypothetical protein